MRLSWLLWGGFGVALLQMVPLLFIKTATGALMAAAYLGVIGAFAQGALTDLSIRSAPRGLEGTMGMLFIACYYIAFRFGDLFGTALYDRYGFAVPVIATIVSTALVLPVLMIVPKCLIETRDGEKLSSWRGEPESGDAQSTEFARIRCNLSITPESGHVWNVTDPGSPRTDFCYRRR